MDSFGLASGLSDDMDDLDDDICRVCRTNGSADRPLFYPCLCIGSIKYIHQECLTQWLKHSKKEICELCNHRYCFMPIYDPSMPKRLPVSDLLSGLFKNLSDAIRFWIHYTFVAIAWLGIVPLSACRIYRSLFTGSIQSLLRLPMDMLSTHNIRNDIMFGGLIIAITLCTFISLVWLREQIMTGGTPLWMIDNRPIAAVPLPDLPVVDPNDLPPNDNDVAQLNVAPEEPQQPVPVAGQDENNWQPFEWQHAAEELTWERLLGLDGSLVFLEHVFWVISLNTLFIFVFAFSPYHVGGFAVRGFNITTTVKLTHFEGVVTTLLGYVIIAFGLLCSFFVFRFAGLKKLYKIMGTCYLVVKVFLLILVEIGLFPVACGWWLDICSMNLFSANVTIRLDGLERSPGTTNFVHWLIGMIFVFYFASFVLLIREVLRPGVLWFLRNLNDPEFNPIHEMLQQNVLRHIKRFMASLVLFGIQITLLVFVPLQIITYIMPSVLPYNISLNIDAPLSELSLELLLLQVILPTLLEQGHTRVAFKQVLRYWCIWVGRCLGLTTYLLPADDPENLDQPQPLPVIEAAGEERPRQPGEPTPVQNQPYVKPSYFGFRICLLVSVVTASCIVTSIVLFTVPVTVGRIVMYLLIGRLSTHELYTVASGLYLSWLLLRGVVLVTEWFPHGWDAVANALLISIRIVSKCLAAAIPLVGIMPLILGLLFQLVVITPLRVSINQSPLYFPWQDWAMGILHCKIICAVVLMGPDWWLKSVLEHIYQDGFRNMSLRYIYTQLAIPSILFLSIVLALPYAVAHTFLPIAGFDEESEVLFQRHVYPSMLVILIVVSFIIWQFKQIQSLLSNIRNEKIIDSVKIVMDKSSSLSSKSAKEDNRRE